MLHERHGGTDELAAIVTPRLTLLFSRREKKAKTFIVERSKSFPRRNL